MSWTGKLLRIDLANSSIKPEALNMEDARTYVGARGLGTKYYCDECDPNIDPLGPDNKLIFMTGPLTGTASPSAGRYNVVCKAPLTNTIEASNSGGHWGAELKYAGWDGIIFENQADGPVYLYINDGTVELRDATDLWGKDVHETTDILTDRLGDQFKIAAIGPCGENGNLFGVIMNEKNRAAGRGGTGAVMGSKNLKAIAVRGTGGVKSERPQETMDAILRIRDQLAAHPVTGQGLKAYGTEILVNIVNEVGGLPLRNGRDGSYFDKADDISGEALAQKYLLRSKGCFGCSIACGRIVKIATGTYKSFGEGPEYEAGWSFGAACGINDLDAVCDANFKCNEYGMDPITLGSTIACAMELFEMGVIPESDIGFPLKFGDAEAMFKCVMLTCNNEGFGKTLALGSYRMAEKYGHPELSMSVKKQETPAYDGRAIQGIGLEYATSNRGGCHVRGYMISPEVLGLPVKMDPQTTEGKAPMLKTFQDLTALCDSLGMCLFTTFGLGLTELADLWRADTGSDESDADILLKGERIWNLEKLYNVAAGIEKDTLPPRMLREALPDGPAKGKVNELQTMLKEYYEVRGWNIEGQPSAEKLEELSLNE
jgi:aldehyde:ferredoxin oxidoreductase